MVYATAPTTEADAMPTVDDFEITVRPDQGGYLAGVARLGLYARGATPVDAFAILERKKAALAADIVGVGVPEPFPQGVAAPPPIRFWDAVGLFAAKALIVCLLIATALGIGGAI